MQVNFEIFNLLLRLTKLQHHYSLTNAFQLVFSDKTYCKVDFQSTKFSRSHMISYQSLLLSTIVLNDSTYNASRIIDLQSFDIHNFPLTPYKLLPSIENILGACHFFLVSFSSHIFSWACGSSSEPRKFFQTLFLSLAAV